MTARARNRIIAGLVGAAVIVSGYFVFVDQNNQGTIMQEGMQVQVLQEGAGAEARRGSTVSIHYVGTLEDGTKFDSSVDRGQPISFTVGAGELIPGFDAGVEGMRVGEKRLLIIPPELAYGPDGIPDSPIGPNATLMFEVELISVS